MLTEIQHIFLATHPQIVDHYAMNENFVPMHLTSIFMLKNNLQSRFCTGFCILLVM